VAGVEVGVACSGHDYLLPHIDRDLLLNFCIFQSLEAA
jgi:hypothetical protein